MVCTAAGMQGSGSKTLTIEAAYMTTRTCPACGYKFTAVPGEVPCSATCAGAAGMAAVYDGLRRFAGQQHVVHDQRERRMSH
jgi:hypothetical protein